MSALPSEDRLLPDKRLYETLMNSIRGIVWEADPLTFQFSYVSPHAERILGYPARQWIDEPDFWKTHTHPDDVKWASTFCRDASTKGIDHEFQYRMIAADGRIVWLHDIVTVVRSDDGAVRLRGIMFDITEHKEVEDALQASEDRLRVIFDTSHSGIIMIESDGHISFANKRMAEMLCCPLPELIGSPYLNHLHPDEQPASDILLDQLMNREIDHAATERHYLCCDGSDFWGYVTSTRLKTVNGTPQALIAVVTDITNHKKQQLALLEETARWHMVMERSRDGIVILDGASCLVRDVNSAFAEMLGYTRNEMTGMHPWDWDLGFTREEIEAMAAESTKADIFFLTRMRRKDNTTRDVEVSATLTELNRQRQFFCICRDITERKKAEDAIRRDKAMLRCFIDSVGDLIFIKDINGAYQACNKASEEFIGLPESEQIGKTDFDFFGRNVAEVIRELDRQVLASGKESHFEEWVTYRDGRRGLLDTVKTPFYGPDGKQLGLVGIARDITQRKRAEEALRESEELFHTLCDSAPIGIFRTDADGNRIYCSPGWENITGMSASEGMEMGWVKGIHPDDLEEHMKVWNEAVAAGHIYSHEHRRLTPQGKTIWVRTLANPVKSPDGKISGYVGTIEEISELRQARQDMLKNQKIESLGVLAGGIAHDFNNILTIILGNISLARLQLNYPEKVTSQLEKAEKATARAKELAQQLLTFARGGEPVKKIIEVRGLLKEAAGFALHGSNVRGEFVLADDLWPVEADEGQLGQVFQNLVLNAVQAMPEGGTVTISAENATSPVEGNRFVKISVADTGTGISEHHLQRIFDPYFTTKQQGSGLGLATCYSIIRKHGGKIRATSTLGKGSTFHISLPGSEQESVSEPYYRKAVSHGSGHVLVMDDEEDIRELTQAILEELGYTAESVENGTEAVDLYWKRKEEGKPFSAVILDLTIPGGVGGKETIEKLLKIDPDIKAIVSSGYSTDPIMANYRDYGFSAVLIKPYRPEEISKVLQKLLKL
jgi:PAS domain S-box-containing protein